MRRYLLIFGGMTALALALVMGANIAIDPYAIGGSNLPNGVNAIKPEFGDHHVLGKPFVAWRRAPQALVLGTSREHYGIDPNDPAWPTPAGAGYNLSMDFASMADIERLFEHATAVSPIETVVIGLDFLDMFDAGSRGALNFDPDLLVQDDYPRALAPLNALRYFASWSMFRDSLRTLRNQDPRRVEIDPDGQRNKSVFEGNAARLGLHQMFNFSEVRYLRTRINLPMHKRYTPIDAEGRSTLLPLARLLDRAAERGIVVHLFVTPVHARQLEVYRTLGLWNEIEKWKRDVLRVSRGEYLRSTSQSFPLWDFADYVEATSEPVPAAGDRTSRMKWYWESSHYTTALGHHVLNRIFRTGETPLSGFGVELDETRIDRHLTDIRRRGVEYRQLHPKDVQDIATAAAEVRRSGITEAM